MAFVLDCSVTMAWIFRDEATEATDRLRETLLDTQAFVPALWPIETANALLAATRRGRVAQDEWPGIRAHLDALPIEVDPVSASRTWSTALDLADAHALSVYDAMYLELAVRMQMPLATLDRALLGAARLSGTAQRSSRHPGGCARRFATRPYNGRHPWTAAEDVSDLLATVGAELAPFQPSQRYFLLDVNHNAGLDPSGPEHENLVSALVRLESGRSPGEMLAALDALRRRLSGPGDENLKRAFREWARQVELPEEVLARVRDVTEGDVMLRERLKEWTEQWKEEGRVELIHRLVARKFDRATADRFKERLERMRDTNQAAEAGIWILECESAEELLSRLERAPARADGVQP